MRYVGIDIAAEYHVVAVVDENGAVLLRPVSVGEEAAGYRRLRELLGDPANCLVATEATGHYWRNLFAWLAAEGFSVALINPLRTRRFAEEELERTKTDKVDAVGIARFAAQKHPAPTEVAEPAIEELSQPVRLRETTIQHLGERVRNLRQALDLAFPEFTATCAVSIPGSPLPSCVATPQQRRCERYLSASWRDFVSTVVAESAPRSRAVSSRPPISRSGIITGSRISFRYATLAKISSDSTRGHMNSRTT